MSETSDFRFRSILLPALAPTLLFSLGEGAILPIIPVVSERLGSGLGGATLVSAMILVGNLLGDVPSGSLIARIGERKAMIGAAAVSAVGLVLALVAPNTWVLGAGILLVGIATAVFALARHAFMTSFVPSQYRARALSTLGGTFRLGYFVGPFVTAGVLHVFVDARSAFVVHLVCCLGAAVLLLVLPDPTEKLAAARGAAPDEPSALFPTIWRGRRIHATIGVGAMTLAALRASRNLVLPLWAVSIGLDPRVTALVIGGTTALDVALFYLGGLVMDRLGRQWAAAPATFGLALSLIVLAFTHDFSHPLGWFIALAVTLALSNGLSAGILMTIGADLADPRRPATFLGAWRFQTDGGGAIASLLLAGVTAAASLPVAVGTIGVVGIAGGIMLVRYIPRLGELAHSSHPTPVQSS